MTESESPSAPPAAAPAPPRRGGSLLAWLIVTAVLAAAAYGGWRAVSYAKDTVGAVSAHKILLERLEGELKALRSQGRELQSAVGRNAAAVEGLGQRLDTAEQTVARLAGTVEGGRTRVQLAAIEQLLLLANDRLLLARDTGTALVALEMADRRLAAQADPRLHRVREALAQERAALASVAQPDVSGASLALTELARRAPKLPLRARVPEEFEPAAVAVEPPADASWPQRVWAAIRTAVGSMFSLRRDENASPRLLAPDQEALVVQILQLKLDGARLALLAREAAAFRDLAAASRDWLRDYYQVNDPAVGAAIAELDQLAALELAPELPDISRSLALLRAQLQSSPQ